MWWLKSTKDSYEIKSMVAALDRRIEHDAKRMGRWRQFHRSFAVVLTLVMTILPAALATGVIPYRDNLTTKFALFTIAVVSTLNVAYKPYQQSLRRRHNKTASLDLLHRYRLEIAQALSGDDQNRLGEIYKSYSSAFFDLYSKRADDLTENEARKSLP